MSENRKLFEMWATDQDGNRAKQWAKANHASLRSEAAIILRENAALKRQVPQEIKALVAKFLELGDEDHVWCEAADYLIAAIKKAEE